MHNFSDDYNTMKKPVLILSVVLLFFAITACSSGRKYNIYRLEGGEEIGNYGKVSHPTKTSMYGAFYNLRSDGDYYWGILNIDGARDAKAFDFILQTTVFDRGGSLGGLWYKGLYTEPYNLSIRFDTGWGAERVIINKLLFKSKKQVIDLREKITVGGSVDAKNLSDFRSSGVLYTRYWKDNGISLDYKNVDIIYSKNRDFTIECDITIEYKDDRIENYAFTAKFKRYNFTERICLPTSCCAYFIYGFAMTGR